MATVRRLTRTSLSISGMMITTPGPLPPACRVHVPATGWLAFGAEFRGRAVFTRRFGRPTGLAAGDRVDLVLERIDAGGTVTLNGTTLGTLPGGQPSSRFDITSRLQRRNELTVEVEWRPPPSRPEQENPSGSLIGEVRLEIHGAP